MNYVPCFHMICNICIQPYVADNLKLYTVVVPTRGKKNVHKLQIKNL